MTKFEAEHPSFHLEIKQRDYSLMFIRLTFLTVSENCLFVYPVLLVLVKINRYSKEQDKRINNLAAQPLKLNK